jgi:hypothetical protein
MSPSELKDVKPGPIRHKQVPDFLLDMMRWSYKIVGRFIVPTLEQWELGFMRDLNMERQVGYWHRLAFAFITWHSRAGVGLRSDDVERKLIGGFIAGKSETEVVNGVSLRECWERPDGWEKEVARFDDLTNDAIAHWSPPEHLKDWPRPDA